MYTVYVYIMEASMAVRKDECSLEFGGDPRLSHQGLMLCCDNQRTFTLSLQVASRAQFLSPPSTQQEGEKETVNLQSRIHPHSSPQLIPHGMSHG